MACDRPSRGCPSRADTANGALAEGIEASLPFTFFGLDAIHRGRHEHMKVATVGNPGLHLATMLGGLPGVSSVITHYLDHKMAELDIPPVPGFLEMIADTGAGLYGCKAPVDLFGLGRDDFISRSRTSSPSGSSAASPPAARSSSSGGELSDHCVLGSDAKSGRKTLCDQPGLSGTLGGMCRAVRCRKCGRPTWKGCGAHVDQVLRDVPPTDRCHCRDDKSTTAATGWRRLLGTDRNAASRSQEQAR